MNRVLTAAAVCLAIATAASADQIVQTENFSGTPNFNQTLTFDQFDTLGGTRVLNSIQVIFDLNSHGGTYILDNDGDEAASGTFEFGVNGDIASTDVSLLDATVQPVVDDLEAVHSQAFNLAANTGDVANDFDPSAPDGLQYDGGDENVSDSGFIGAAFFTTGTKGFVGTGDFDIVVDAGQTQDFGGVSGIETGFTPMTSDGFVRVIYDYDVIPEPASMALLGAGGLAMLRRKR